MRLKGGIRTNDVRKRGRPNKNDSRKLSFGTKLNKEERDMLIFLMEKMGFNVSETIRYALKACFNKEKGGE